MPSFVYVARETASGREIRSSVEAATEQAAISALLNRNMLVVSIAEKVGKKGKTSGARVESGDSFSEALQKHPKAFSRLYTCMVAAGEKGGLLAEILARLATYLENAARLRKKVKS